MIVISTCVVLICFFFYSWLGNTNTLFSCILFLKQFFLNNFLADSYNTVNPDMPLSSDYSACLSDFAGDQILDEVQHSSCVCLYGDVLHLYQDHPQHSPVWEITQWLLLSRYTSSHLSARLFFWCSIIIPGNRFDYSVHFVRCLWYGLHRSSCMAHSSARCVDGCFALNDCPYS